MINEGDILLVKQSGIVSNLIRTITKSNWNHSAYFISNKYFIEADFSGVKVSNLGELKYKEFAIYRCPEATQSQIYKATEFCQKQVGTKYEFFKILKLFFLYILNLSKNTNIPDNDKKWICSELVVESYAQANIKLFDNIKTDNVVPGDFAKTDKLQLIISIKR